MPPERDKEISQETKERVLAHFKRVLNERGNTMREEVREYYRRTIEELEKQLLSNDQV